MALTCKSLLYRIIELRVPIEGEPWKVYALGVINMVLFGWGMILSGFMNNCAEDVIIGLMQFIIPFVGWIWAIFWGILIVSHKFADTRSNNRLKNDTVVSDF
ncbi:uncharacterized protein BEWA_007420 [Theileria equi strain WA]|uniref:Membrane protein, putative n=1 Tax=Theileria equi strain WA TaxID=1537102 RepID=L0B1F3_THEEQ|nr:uncharacterized protein BEWA_007420 [Theileria equi strain WA]AFZ81333.1 membrane protein, putative [Theileria equi strain WA]|eukprot:XP_004830999.1 uncharacterized protein BEWA_007420 [Theileria equi strain WA]